VSHVRKPLIAAAALNTTIVAAELAAGASGHSLSLIMDAVHNSSDELALICLCLAYCVRVGWSRGLQQSANFFNSVGLIGLSLIIVWQAVDRFFNPAPVLAAMPIVVGALAALANLGVALLLKRVSYMNPAIRLAYLHNTGDVAVSFGPVAAGVLIAVTGITVFDPLIAAATAGWITWATIQEVREQADAYLWPAAAVCIHEGEELGVHV
jgi:cobalt-zinc-cadmium efflux system protein